MVSLPVTLPKEDAQQVRWKARAIKNRLGRVMDRSVPNCYLLEFQRIALVFEGTTQEVIRS